MLDVTTPNFCNLIKIISPNVILFSEMYVDNTIIHASTEKLDSYFNEYPKETVIQLGGSNPSKISASIKKLKQRYGFMNYNLNCGCPSDKVRAGRFGAVLMREVDVVCKIINLTYVITGVVLSVKCRIGVEDNLRTGNIKFDGTDWYTDDDYKEFYNFIMVIQAKTMCRVFYIHCRKCVLNGFSPKDNREIPPLNYSFAHEIKKKFTNLEIHINGGIKKLEDLEHVANCDGVMIGRGVINNPFIFYELSGGGDRLNRLEDVLIKYFDLFQEDSAVKNGHILPIMNLCKGLWFKTQYKQIICGFVADKIHFQCAKKHLKKFLMSIINNN